jgi:peptidoglycan/LPS O-acetylase OafA/YrhL
MVNDIGALTGLRGVAALWVLFFHVSVLLARHQSPLADFLYPLARGGYLGVDLFFVLSGFVIAYNYAAQVPTWSFRDYVAFLIKRLARIYPIHVVGLGLVAFVWLVTVSLGAGSSQGRVMTIDGLITSLLLVHAWSVPVVGTWNVASWSVSLEWAAYIAYPVVAWTVAKLRSPTIAVLAILVLFAGLAAFVLTVPLPGTMAYGVLRIIAAFTTGVLLHKLWKRRRSTISVSVALGVLLALVVGAAVLEHMRAKGALIYAPVLAALTVYCLASCTPVLTSRAMQHLGHISYALYIVHLPILLMFEDVARWHGLNMAWALLGVPASILMAHWLFVSIETPARRWVISYLPPSATARPAVLEDATRT